MGSDNHPDQREGKGTPLCEQAPETAAAALQRELDGVRRLGAAGLRDRWIEVFGRSPPKSLSANKLARAISYRLQVAHYGVEDTLLPASGLTQISSLTDGAGVPLVLRRVWDGRDHEVIKDGNTFLYAGKPYASLSAVARAITGTRWNGWTFFGLTNPGLMTRSRKNG